MPACAHFASVAAAAELDVVGVRADRERVTVAQVDGRHRRRCPSRSCSDGRREVEEVVGDVDVEGEVGAADDAHASAESRAPRRRVVGRIRGRTRTRNGSPTGTRAARGCRRRGGTGRASTIGTVTVAAEPCERAGTRQVGVRDDRRGRRRARRTTSRPASAAASSPASRVVDDVDALRARPRADLGGARHDDDGQRRRRVHDPRRRSRGASSARWSSVEVGRRGAASHRTNDRIGTRRPRRERRRTMGLRMLPAWSPLVLGGAHGVAPAAPPRHAVDLRGCTPHPDVRSGDPREQPRVVSRSSRARATSPIGGTGEVRFLAKAELFDKRGLGWASAQDRGRSRCSGTPSTPRRRSMPRSQRCDGGECVAVFPEGTISLDLEPMAGKTGTARLAAASGRPGHTGRALGRAPHHVQGPQAALEARGRRDGRRRRSRARSTPDDDVHDATDRIMEAICRCVAGRGRSIRSSRAPPTTTGGCASPETAVLRPSAAARRPLDDARRGDRRRVLGHGSRVPSSRRTRDVVLWARDPELATPHRRATTRTPSTSPGIGLPSTAARDVGPRRRRATAPTSS